MKSEKRIPKFTAALLLVFCLFIGVSDVLGQALNEELLTNFQWRELGPTRQSGRIVDIAVPLQYEYTWYIAVASGNVWKTENNGTTFEPIFDTYPAFSIGDIAVAPSDPETFWVGTGEANNSRSAYWGNGVYKSTDGGKTFRHMGLPESHHVGRIVIHPTKPDIVYVAALGHLYSSNPERGLYKTTNGGRSWELVLDTGPDVGVVDAVMNPDNPDILYAASYHKERVPWNFQESGTKSAIYKTTDAGKTWTKLGGGLPDGMIGRIGLDIYAKNPDILYASIENSNPPSKKQLDEMRKAFEKENPGMEFRAPEVAGGEIYRTGNGGKSWKKVNKATDNIGGRPGYYYGQIRIDPNDDKHIIVLSVGVHRSTDGGKTWGRGSSAVHGDHHAWWFDPQTPGHIIQGNDGGVAVSYDNTKTWDFYDQLPLAQYYAISIDMEHPYNIYGGLQDNGSWRGPSTKRNGNITMEDWLRVGGGDGFYNVVDPTDSRWLYNESQFGNMSRIDQKTGVSKRIRPTRGSDQPRLRWNWNTPIFISPHNSKVIYVGSQVLHRSMNQGDSWQEVSPDLTTNHPDKREGNKGNIQYCTITTIDESPLTPGLIWVGTDDGNVQVTKDGGATWTLVNRNIPGHPGYWVSRVTASHFDEATAYVSFTGYRRDDFRPFVYKTTDYGRTWTSIAGNLPDGPVNVIKEHHINADLLFIGTEFGAFVSIDGGANWVSMKNNMPSQPVQDLLVHPREDDLVVSTHGRGIFVTDISPLHELNSDLLQKDVHLFNVEKKTQWVGGFSKSISGHRHFEAPAEPKGLMIYYYLKNNAREDVKIVITDPYGKQLEELDMQNTQGEFAVSNNAGINKVLWDMRTHPKGKRPVPKAQDEQSYWRRGPAGKLVKPGEYVIKLMVGGKEYKQIGVIEEDFEQTRK